MKDRFGEVPNNKPFKGTITNWYKVPCGDDLGLGYVIYGYTPDHPEFAGMGDGDTYFHTSYIVAHNEETGDVETRNSRYRVIGPAIR